MAIPDGRRNRNPAAKNHTLPADHVVAPDPRHHAARRAAAATPTLFDAPAAKPTPAPTPASTIKKDKGQKGGN